MRALFWAAACIGLLSRSTFADTSDSDDPCEPYQAYGNVCLWYPSETMVFVCKEDRFIPTEEAELITVQPEGTYKKRCEYWVRRDGLIVDDELLAAHASGPDSDSDSPVDSEEDDEEDAATFRDENRPLRSRAVPLDLPFSGPRPGKGKPWIPLDTRCDPRNNTKVQVFRHGWYPAYDCPVEHTCIDIGRTHMPGRAGCNNVDGTYDVPDPHNWEPDMVRRDNSYFDTASVLDLPFLTRCDPAGSNILQRRVWGSSEYDFLHQCPDGNPCVEFYGALVRGMAACDLGKGNFHIPYASVSPSKKEEPPSEKRQCSGKQRQAPKKKRQCAPKWKCLHSWDTRCNPRNLTEVQRFDGKKWVLHAVCMLKDSCRDVNGIGACWLGMHHYDLPSANDTMDAHSPLPPAPVLMKDRCDPHNEKQVLTWTMNGWKIGGYCIDPYVCEDFQNAGFIVCIEPVGADPQHRMIWRPWNQWNGATSVNGTDMPTVRCKDRTELVRLIGNSWVHDSDCTHGWVCRNDVTPPHTGGCFALYIKALDVYQNFLASSAGGIGLNARNVNTNPYPPIPPPPPKSPESRRGVEPIPPPPPRARRDVPQSSESNDVDDFDDENGTDSSSDDTDHDYLDVVNNAGTYVKPPKYRGMHERRMHNLSPNVQPLD